MEYYERFYSGNSIIDSEDDASSAAVWHEDDGLILTLTPDGFNNWTVDHVEMFDPEWVGREFSSVRECLTAVRMDVNV